MNEVEYLRQILEERFTLLAVPAAMCGLLQLAGFPDAPQTFGLRIGHVTHVVTTFTDACIERISRRPPTIPWPKLEAWKPVLLHTFVHRDFSHFANNLIVFLQALIAARFPSFASGRGLPRGLFLSALLFSGSVVSALGQDRSFKYNTQKVQEKYAYGIEAVKAVVGSSHEKVLSNLMLVGASGGVMSLVGFNCTFAPRLNVIVPTAIMVGADVLAEWNRPRSEFWVHDTVANAGHLGGFAWGLAVGALCRAYELRQWLRDYRRQGEGRTLGRG